MAGAVFEEAVPLADGAPVYGAFFVPENGKRLFRAFCPTAV